MSEGNVLRSSVASLRRRSVETAASLRRSIEIRIYIEYKSRLGGRVGTKVCGRPTEAEQPPPLLHSILIVATMTNKTGTAAWRKDTPFWCVDLGPTHPPSLSTLPLSQSKSLSPVRRLNRSLPY